MRFKLHKGWVLTVLILASGLPGSQPAVAELPQIKSASYDGQARFLVNDQPFFPILLYGAPTDEATLTSLKDYGFNVLACGPEECPPLPAQGFYGAVHAGRKPIDDLSAILFSIGTDSPALYYKKDLLAQTAEANAKTAAAVPDRPLFNAIG